MKHRAVMEFKFFDDEGENHTAHVEWDYDAIKLYIDGNRMNVGASPSSAWKLISSLGTCRNSLCYIAARPEWLDYDAKIEGADHE